MRNHFVQILLQETIDLRVENLFDKEEYFHNLSKNSFQELLNLIMNE